MGSDSFDYIKGIHNRLNTFIQYLGLTKTQFAANIGESTARVVAASNINNEGYRSDFRVSLVAKIVHHYPQLNMEWLILNKGEMIKS